MNSGRKSPAIGDQVMGTVEGQEQGPKYQVKVQSLETRESDNETREVIVKDKEI